MRGFLTPWCRESLRGPDQCWSFFADGPHCLRGVGQISKECHLSGVTGVTGVAKSLNLLNFKVKCSVTLSGRIQRVRCNAVERCNAIVNTDTKEISARFESGQT